MQPGTRVGAILSEDYDDGEGVSVVQFLGYGIYAGGEVPPEDINPAFNFGQSNPKIELDNGDVVWGMECWWGPEEEIKEHIKGKTIEEVDIKEVRQAHKLGQG